MSDIPKIKALPPTPQTNTPRPRARSRGYTTPPDPPSSHPTIEVTAPLSPVSTHPETNRVSDLIMCQRDRKPISQDAQDRSIVRQDWVWEVLWGNSFNDGSDERQVEVNCEQSDDDELEASVQER